MVGLFNCFPEGLLGESSISTGYLLVWTPYVGYNRSKYYSTEKICFRIVLLVICTYTTSLKWSIINWLAQIIAISSLTKNCSTNPGWTGCNWSTEMPSPGFSFVSLRIDLNFLPFVLHVLWRYLPNMQEAQSVGLSLRQIKRFGRNPSCDG